MAAVIDSPVIRELAAILQAIDPFPNPNDSDFTTCRGFKKGSTSRCGMRACPTSEQNQVDDLLSQFQIMTTCVDTNDLYDEIQTFINLTHCRHHRDDAGEAFNRWKAQRKAAISSQGPITPSRSTTSYNESFESISDISSMGSPSFTSDSSEYDEFVLDFRIAEKMKSLKIATSFQDTGAQTGDSGFGDVEAQRERLKRLGTFHCPEDGEEQDHVKIYQTMEKRLSAQSMPAGILYVLEHTKIPGLHKIGWSKHSAKLRLKQPKNCYKFETRIIHETEGETFNGASQAERIAQAILRHKKLLIVKCVHCNGSHHEWFLASRQDALSAVMLAERWLKMPAYALQHGVYRLTPEADNIHKIMLPFSISRMNVLIDKGKKSDNTSGAFPSAAAVQETSASSTSPAAVTRTVPKISINESLNTTPSQRYQLRGKSPVGGVDGGKRETPWIETEEVFEMYQRRSRETTPDGEHIIVTDLTTTVRKKISKAKLEQDIRVYDCSKPVDFDPKSKKQSTEVKVRELQKA
ncbi:hypothetical protein ACHAQJ_002414 [Trichoderma viride]